MIQYHTLLTNPGDPVSHPATNQILQLLWVIQYHTQGDPVSHLTDKRYQTLGDPVSYLADKLRWRCVGLNRPTKDLICGIGDWTCYGISKNLYNIEINLNLFASGMKGFPGVFIIVADHLEMADVPLRHQFTSHLTSTSKPSNKRSTVIEIIENSWLGVGSPKLSPNR